MSVRTVTRDDFANAARSYVVVGVVVVFAGLVGLVFVAENGVFDDPYRTLYDVGVLVGLVFPLLLAPLTYLAVAGERSSGTIKYVLGLPNSRRGYLLGKFVSRFGVAVAAIAIALLVGLAIAVGTYANPPEVGRFVAFLAVSALFAFAMTGLFVAVSASTATRSRAMLGVFLAYFVLVPFWLDVLPVVNLSTVLDAVGTALGSDPSERTRHYVEVLSPVTAYLRSTELVYAGVVDEYDALQAFRTEGSPELYERWWFGALVLIAWGVGSMAVGYVRFARSELG